MTLRRSILFSLALHLLLVGTGFTFARFAGDLLRGRHDAVMVALIGCEGTSASGKAERPAATPAPKRINTERNKAVVRDPIPLRQSATAAATDALQAPDAERQPEGERAAPHEDAPRQQAGASGESTKGSFGESTGESSVQAGPQSGAVSSEQWAVIVSSIERVKNYPRIARERSIEGVVRLRFKVRPQGSVEHVEIVKSSGSDILDTASVNTLYRAGPMPYVNGWVEVPIAYVLR